MTRIKSSWAENSFKKDQILVGSIWVEGIWVLPTNITLLSSFITHTVAMNHVANLITRCIVIIYSGSSPCQGRASVCPNMPIMALTACISRHQSIPSCHNIFTDTRLWSQLCLLIGSDSGYLNQIADNWCRCQVTRPGSSLRGWLWSHQGPDPAPGRSSYSWDQHHQDFQRILISWLSFPFNMTHSLHSSLRSLINSVLRPIPAVLQTHCRMLQRKWLMAGWRLFTFRMRAAAVTGSSNVTVSKD